MKNRGLQSVKRSAVNVLPFLMSLRMSASYVSHKLFDVSKMMKPSLRITLFFGSAVSMSLFAFELAWPNVTSVVRILVQVPMAHVMTGLQMVPR